MYTWPCQSVAPGGIRLCVWPAWAEKAERGPAGAAEATEDPRGRGLCERTARSSLSLDKGLCRNTTTRTVRRTRCPAGIERGHANKYWDHEKLQQIPPAHLIRSMFSLPRVVSCECVHLHVQLAGLSVGGCHRPQPVGLGGDPQGLGWFHQQLGGLDTQQTRQTLPHSKRVELGGGETNNGINKEHKENWIVITR